MKYEAKCSDVDGQSCLSTDTPTSEINFVTTGINQGSYAFILVNANTNDNFSSVTIDGVHNPMAGSANEWEDNTDILIKIEADTDTTFRWKVQKF